jgi:hypothetical protein
MPKYYSTYGVSWGEKSEVENLNPTPANSSSLSQFPQSTSGICRLNRVRSQHSPITKLNPPGRHALVGLFLLKTYLLIN